ncbi:MAG: thiamine diphosphokinase [Bacteroidota bacterium]|jgi:thiamine pyrophosphokinase|nr:thiamine diphosphokinase [Ignavibacteria bacterium]MCU7501201.1 thiamine diphosphokinase [Ignavibacteria bacterium]MCU7511915.1 thiamine diphosphokinase [Ignavibacteria bacterium]MCU7520052.1 thiamine diphosphokinase [Ignavibacteria bacterium]MCU7525416.1 thiamine diphosphokinase [Ignavibacteria bacterium]
MKKCIIIANGKAPKKSIFPFLKGEGYSTIICADGGANSAKRLNIIPDFIIGDLDSIHPDTMKFYESKAVIKRVKSQDDTDVEKCLKFAIKNGFSECVLTGVIGDRLDHSFSNLGIVLRYSKLISLKVISERSFLTVHKGNFCLKAIPGETISIYAFDRKTKISSTGLKYELLNATLPYGLRESTSNEAVSEEVHLKVKGGLIFIIRDFNLVKKHDLF